ncbi:MAG TPA: response regulator [Candidatus Nitrosotenuis sp.]|nr:response regulator [Candidatus Nitrosotenuis sp.]
MTTTAIEVLVAGESAECRRDLGSILTRFGVSAAYSSTVRETQRILAERPVWLIFCDEELADGDFRDVLRAAKTSGGRVPVVISTRNDDWDNYLEALRLGAFDYLVGPFSAADVELLVRYAFRSAQAHKPARNGQRAPQAA